MKISIASDHAGFELKEVLKQYLQIKNIEVKDFGTNSLESVDYADYVHPLGRSIEDFDFGIVICGSGNGVAITANKHKKVRAAYCWNEEITALARQHNDANVIVLPARFISQDEAKQFTDIFLSTKFEGGRHIRRVEKISEF